MKFTILDWSLHALVAISLGAVGAISSFLLHDPDPFAFQRFGGVVIALGVVLLGLTAKKVIEVAEKIRSNKDLPSETIDRQERYLRFHARELSSAEIFLIVTGTLQSSYGQLFHCWFNSHGWTTCSP